MLAIAGLVAACGSTAVTSTGPSPVKCGVTLNAPASPIAAPGGIGEVALTTTPECAWTAEAAASWAARIEPASGQGNATLRLDIPANPSSLARQTDVVVNGVRVQIQQQAAPCAFELSSADQVIGAAGGTVRVTVSTLDGCAWTASSSASWMTVTSHGTGQGSGVVELAVGSNAGGARDGSVTIADQSITIGQEAAAATACTYGVSPPTQSLVATGGTLPVTVTTTCAWTAISQVPWITIASPTGSGTGTVVLSVASNAGAARTGTVSIGSAIVTITQAAAANCAFIINPTTGTSPASGVTGLSIGVTGPATCTWVASSNVSWITIASPTTSSGNGTVTLNVAANTGGARNGTVAIAGQTFTLSQAGGCTVALNPLTASVPVAGGTGQVGVTAAGSCPWTASSDSAWLTITAGASGSGNGTVRYSAAANTGAARTGTLTVAGQTASITQASGCSYGVNPTSTSISAAGGAGPTINVTAAAGCTWSASSGVSWITLTGGATGTGAGAVTFSVASNSGSARSGTLSVAGQTVSVSQAGPCTFVVTLAPLSFPKEGGTATGGVVTTAACAWTASSDSGWITPTSATSGSGSATVSFRIDSNPGPARSGSVTIAGQTFTISEAKK